MSEDRIIAVFDNPRVGESEGHPVQIAVQIPGSNHINSIYLNQREALALYHGIADYLIAHRDRDALPNFSRRK